jgi:hypothetical protein
VPACRIAFLAVSGAIGFVFVRLAFGSIERATVLQLENSVGG